ncbi:MAG TPA: hypothetical protein VMA09_17950 [Candidatus Binataceae bacterium]|nr:hypothetical protein [Candidatus Binataceae bacterium]
MKNETRLLLGAALMVLIGGCSSTTPNTAAPGYATDSAAEHTTPNLDFAAKCPAVHYEKLQAWTDLQVMQQEKIKEGDIAACEQWIARQPAGYVPPVPTALVPGATANAPYEGRGNAGAGPGVGPPPAQVAP